MFFLVSTFIMNVHLEKKKTIWMQKREKNDEKTNKLALYYIKNRSNRLANKRGRTHVLSKG